MSLIICKISKYEICSIIVIRLIKINISCDRNLASLRIIYLVQNRAFIANIKILIGSIN